jgi:transposase
MTPRNLLPSVYVTPIVQNAHQLTLIARSNLRCATCPHCGTFSTRIHGHYIRRPKDLPWGDRAVRLELRLNRYRCTNPDCSTLTFAEPLQDLLTPHAQRTTRLEHVQSQIGLLLSANSAVSLLETLRMPCSRDTVLRAVKRLKPPLNPTPSTRGVDDWAFRKGERYGAILVDLERHCVVDLLPDPTGATLEVWLRSHPGAQIIARDRASEFSSAISRAAPDARQVADRFHLVQNLSATVQVWLERRKKTLFESLRRLESSPERLPAPMPPPLRGYHIQTKRAERLEQYDRAMSLHNDGAGVAQIARTVGAAPSTVRWWLQRGSFPNRGVAQRSPPSKRCTCAPVGRKVARV